LLQSLDNNDAKAPDFNTKHTILYFSAQQDNQTFPRLIPLLHTDVSVRACVHFLSAISDNKQREGCGR